MENSKIGWYILIIALFVTTFGFFWCCTILACVFTFSIGLLSLLFIQQGDVDKYFQKCAGNPLNVQDIEGGFKQLRDLVENPYKVSKSDRRVTGSELIDSSLQEILGYIIRDYVTPWYCLISVDQDFPEVTVRNTSQTLAINISNRIKDVDWIPYITTKLVDDVASHLRLFKQSRSKLEMNNKFKVVRDQKSSPIKRSIHKRNKSEADVTQCNKDTGNSKFYLTGLNKKNLEDYFFELECQMENNTICRDLVCTDSKREKEFLSELVELLLYILLPDEDFQCKSLRFVLREIFTASVILPVFSMVSDPDFINQTIIWLCAQDNYLPSDIFLTTFRLTDNCDELKYTQELVTKEIQQLRSRDSGGESDISVKQQLSSLFYINKLIDNRMLKLQNSVSADGYSNDFDCKLESAEHIKLPLDIILKNNIALSYFIDYVTTTGLQAYLFFYLNIEGWKASVEQHLSNVHINQIKSGGGNSTTIDENIRITALSIYEQYLGEKSVQKVQLKSSLVQSLFFRIRNVTEPPSEQWFDEVQMAIFDTLQTQDEFLPSFHTSSAYIKLLAELDLLQQNIEEDTISLNSLENVEEEKLIVAQSQTFLAPENPQKINKHVRSFSDIITFSGDDCNELNQTVKQIHPCKQKTKEDLKIGEYTLLVEIIETGIVCEKGKTFGVYAIHVTRQYETGYSEDWHIYRRYSDFYDLHTKIKDKFPNLSKIPFPGKKTFHNMDRAVLERRMRMLGSYLQQLCQLSVLLSYVSLRNLLMPFLEQGDYDRATTGGPISNTIDTIVNPLKSGMKTIKNMPEQFINTVDEVVGGLTKVFNTKTSRYPEASKVGACLDVESDDNIPLRIILLLMDEIFDLKSRNQWLRRRIITLLRQIVRTMFGDIVNRRIVDYVSYITSPKNVAQYLHNFKHSFWPNGVKAERSTERDEATCARTRIAAKAALLSWLSDDLKHIIGSETTRKGFLTIFEMFQRSILNRRLLYVLLEGILISLFPEKDMSGIFQQLHAKSQISTHCDIKKNR